MIGEHTEEMLASDLKFQLDQVQQLKDAIAFCEQQKDFVSRSLLEELLHYEEDYVDWLETQEHLIADLGIQNYLQSQV